MDDFTATAQTGKMTGKSDGRPVITLDVALYEKYLEDEDLSPEERLRLQALAQAILTPRKP